MDNNVMGRGTPDELRSDLSMTVFLSEPGDYQGGELVLDSDMKFAPRFTMPAGTALLYATSSTHRVEPVTHAARLVALTWTVRRNAHPATRHITLQLRHAPHLTNQDGPY